MDATSHGRFAEDQARQNRSTAGQWDLFASHRAALEELLRPGGGSLCVLGAGNCNDLDLAYLTRAFDQVHLVDIDPLALNQAVHRQRVHTSAKVRMHAPIDLSGVAEALSSWQGLPPTPGAFQATLRLAAEAAYPEIGRFDVVLSPCVLSQTIDPGLRLLGPGHPRRIDFAAALRTRHLRLMSHLLTPGGRGVLAIDLASSGYRPDLPQAAEADLPDVMRACLRAETYFMGLAPQALEQTLRADPLVGDVRLTPPWLWHLGIRKCFLVYAMTFRKRP
jgi:hypothetical protein